MFDVVATLRPSPTYPPPPEFYIGCIRDRCAHAALFRVAFIARELNLHTEYNPPFPHVPCRSRKSTRYVALLCVYPRAQPHICQERNDSGRGARMILLSAINRKCNHYSCKNITMTIKLTRVGLDDSADASPCCLSHLASSPALLFWTLAH